MVVRFNNEKLAKLYETPLNELRGKQSYPAEVITQFKKKVAILIAKDKFEDLRGLKGLNFEFLKGDRKGECSIRLNDQYRLIFIPMSEKEIKIVLITDISKHYE